MGLGGRAGRGWLEGGWRVVEGGWWKGGWETEWWGVAEAWGKVEEGWVEGREQMSDWVGDRWVEEGVLEGGWWSGCRITVPAKPGPVWASRLVGCWHGSQSCAASATVVVI
jgi:hypothetical protein